MINKVETLKRIDRLIGTPLSHIALLSRPRCNTLSRNTSPHILFIRPGGIGDAVLLIPAIHAVKKCFPNSSITVLAEKRNAAVLNLCADIDTILRYDKPGNLIAALKKDYDIVIDTEQWHHLSSVIARLTRAPMMIGFATNGRGKLFTHPISYSHNDHELISFMRLLEPFMEMKYTAVKQPFLSLPQVLLDKARQQLLPLAGKKLISVFPGGSVKQKRWEIDKFRMMINLLVQQGYGIVLVGGEDDTLHADEIAGNLPSVLNMCGKLSLAETAAVIKETFLLVSGDSGIMHITCALGTRVLALFGPSNSTKWAPRTEHSVIISHRAPCSPCSRFGYTPECKNNLACMKEITVDEVLTNTVRILENA